MGPAKAEFKGEKCHAWGLFLNRPKHKRRPLGISMTLGSGQGLWLVSVVCRRQVYCRPGNEWERVRMFRASCHCPAYLIITRQNRPSLRSHCAGGGAAPSVAADAGVDATTRHDWIQPASMKDAALDGYPHRDCAASPASPLPVAGCQVFVSEYGTAILR